jgi:hypothetical protein
MAAEMKVLRKATKHTLYDYKKKQDIIKELKTEPVLKKSTTIKLNGYNMFTESTDLDS